MLTVCGVRFPALYADKALCVSVGAHKSYVDWLSVSVNMKAELIFLQTISIKRNWIRA